MKPFNRASLLVLFVEELEAKIAIQAALKHGDAYLGMCSCYQFCEPVAINAHNPTVAAKIMRLSLED